MTVEQPGGPAIETFIKRHESPSRRRGAPRSPGLAEASAARACARAGVPTVRVIAAGEKRLADRGVVRSFFMSESVSGAQQADHFWLVHMGRAGGCARQANRRRRMLQTMAETARRLHDAGFFHRDLYWCHFFIREPRPGTFTAHLIDLQRVIRPRLARWRYRLKDLAQFFFSAPEGRVTKAELRHWYRCYCGTHALSPAQRIGYRAVTWRAALYGYRERRRERRR
jgi:heptose I phosphotransferase